MEEGRIKIDAAFRRMKKEMELGVSLGEKKDLSAHNKRFLTDLDAIIELGKKLPGILSLAEATRNALNQAVKIDRKRIMKKMAAAAKVIIEIEAERYIPRLQAVLESRATDCNFAAPESGELPFDSTSDQGG